MFGDQESTDRPPCPALRGPPLPDARSVIRGISTVAVPVRQNDARVFAASEPEASIVTQSREIIGSILADPNPGLADIQQRLHECVVAHAGFPERALLAPNRNQATDQRLNTGAQGRAVPSPRGSPPLNPVAAGGGALSNRLLDDWPAVACAKSEVPRSELPCRGPASFKESPSVLASSSVSATPAGSSLTGSPLHQSVGDPLARREGPARSTIPLLGDALEQCGLQARWLV